ncbi:uncharacterized protein LOC126675038 isoform X2 [Mercurialis annua]|uniref:uncharacterized protein LOC126675038 isoform X2 n=1 Tax=Mercurialis annua TaxID=3986 RepID=UPI00215FAB14|nr:uncharacterized protein LOC126675038 isoform X2 [Mercurialis annua]
MRLMDEALLLKVLRWSLNLKSHNMEYQQDLILMLLAILMFIWCFWSYNCDCSFIVDTLEIHVDVCVVSNKKYSTKNHMASVFKQSVDPTAHCFYVLQNKVFDTASYSEFVTDKFACTDVANQISSPTGRLRSVSPVGSEADWIEPSMHLCNSRMFHPYSPDRVYDAFHLLQHEPSVKRMVISLSSDKAVWNAVLNNDVVRELRETYNAEENNTPPTLEGSDETSNDSNPAMNAVKWIFENTKAKFMEVFEKITTLINELFKAHVVDNKTTGTMDPFEERLKTSFMLSVVVLLVVVVTRAHRA